MREIQIPEISHQENTEFLLLFCLECGCFCNARASPRVPNRHTGFLTSGQLVIVLSQLTEHLARHAHPVDILVYVQD